MRTQQAMRMHHHDGREKLPANSQSGRKTGGSPSCTNPGTRQSAPSFHAWLAACMLEAVKKIDWSSCTSSFVDQIILVHNTCVLRLVTCMVGAQPRPTRVRNLVRRDRRSPAAQSLAAASLYVNFLIVVKQMIVTMCLIVC